MSEFAIQVEDIGKRYQIGNFTAKNTLRDTIAAMVKAPFRFGKNGEVKKKTPFWALKNISFEVKQGEILGIIGHNGAGKSTLLKILSRITEPTTGHARIYGRVGSLLEVGTGFHSELTGRENIYLNGAILGMKKNEIKRKFDEIVEFAEIEQFLDTPVKRYSSGMHVRLAFAVAAHLEPEILIIDEVLAVGDAAFQKKCLGKMGEVTKEGRTVLFVSHNMVAVQSLCSRVIWLEKGNIKKEGKTDKVISGYLQSSFETLTEQVWEDRNTAPGNEKIRMHRACIRPVNGVPNDPITVRTSIVLEFEYWNLDPGARLNISLEIYNEQGIMIMNAGPTEEPQGFSTGLFQDTGHIPGDLLNDGVYWIEMLIVKDSSEVVYRHPDILIFNVHDNPDMRGAWFGKWPGAVRPILEWQTKLINGLVN